MSDFFLKGAVWYDISDYTVKNVCIKFYIEIYEVIFISGV